MGQILQKFYDFESGKIEVNKEHNLRSIDLTSWRNLVDDPEKSKLDKIPQNEKAIVDFSLCSFVDHTVQESLNSYEELFERKGGTFEVIGLDVHDTDSSHPFAVRTLRPVKKLRVFGSGRTKRQLQLEALAKERTPEPFVVKT